MIKPLLRLALQSRGYLLPALRGEVQPEGFDLDVVEVPDDWEFVDIDGIDGGETSFSRHVLALGMGDERLVGLPNWVMRSFRHRCILVGSDSPLRRLDELAGARIGLTGWPDTGHSWTRAALREAGVDLATIGWWVGALVPGEAEADRLGPGPRPDNLTLLPATRSLLDLLAHNEIDAIFTPFMPPGFHSASSSLRHLLVDYPSHEAGYARRVGYVPGVHLVTLKRQVAETYPGLPAAVSRFLHRCHRRWLDHRAALADEAPWQLREVDAEERTLVGDWNPAGIDSGSSNAKMTADFCHELHVQGVTESLVHANDVFADYRRLS